MSSLNPERCLKGYIYEWIQFCETLNLKTKENVNGSIIRENGDRIDCR